MEKPPEQPLSLLRVCSVGPQRTRPEPRGGTAREPPLSGGLTRVRVPSPVLSGALCRHEAQVAEGDPFRGESSAFVLGWAVHSMSPSLRTLGGTLCPVHSSCPCVQAMPVGCGFRLRMDVQQCWRAGGPVQRGPGFRQTSSPGSPSLQEQGSRRFLRGARQEPSQAGWAGGLWAAPEPCPGSTQDGGCAPVRCVSGGWIPSSVAVSRVTEFLWLFPSTN